MAEAKQSSSTAVDLPSKAQLAKIYEVLRGESELPERADPGAMSRAIMERILAGESFEDVFTQQSLTPWRSMLGRVVFVRSVHFNRSTFEGEGPPIYAVCDLVDADTGEAITVTCGGQNVLAQLVKGLEAGWLVDEKRPVRMIENDTAQGYGALWLEAA